MDTSPEAAQVTAPLHEPTIVEELRSTAVLLGLAMMVTGGVAVGSQFLLHQLG